MSDLEQKIKQAAEQSIIHIVRAGQWAVPSYAEQFKLPPDFMAEVWKLVDKQKIQQLFAAQLEQEIVRLMSERMAKEMAVDIREILAKKDRRDALRALAQNHLKEIMQTGVSK